MNQLCKVCGEPAAGFHFGAFTCEGCKSFFGRTYNNLGSISECKNNGQCVINKKNRTACKACRLRKCVLVGMSKSGSRYGRRSNWFKIHCLLQEQQQAGANIVTAAGLLRPHPYLPLFRHPPLITADAKSSESDSGASSADPEDDVRSASALSCFRASTSPAASDRSTVSSKKLPSPSSDGEYFARRNLGSCVPPAVPAISPGGVFSRWMTPLHGVGDPNSWRDLWLRGSLSVAAPAPEQEQPIDLSVRAVKAKSQVQLDREPHLSIDVGDDIIKPVPLDLTLDRQADVVTN